MKSLKPQVSSLKNPRISRHAMSSALSDRSDKSSRFPRPVCAGLCLSALVCVFALTGCDLQLTADQKQELAQKIIAVLAEKGQERAVTYVEQLEDEGKITPEKAAKIKATIPLGVEKVKTVIEQKIEAKNE